MKTAVLFLAIVLSGCFNSRSDNAHRVKSVENGDGCTSLGVVKGRSPAFALSTSDERIGAMNSAYNNAAELGANAIVLLNVERTNFGGGVVQGEAFDCPAINSKDRYPHPEGW